MQQLHKRVPLETVRLYLSWYESGTVSLDDALTKLCLKRRRFYQLLRQYRGNTLDRQYQPSKRTNAHRRIDSSLEMAIRRELGREKRLIDTPDIPIRTYNYAAVTDSVVRQTGRSVSAQTVRNRAKAWGFFVPRPKPKAKHTRVVLTTATGLLLQHDASHHQWSPYAVDRDKRPVKWCLITTLDDYSRMLLFAAFVPEETTWEHILALRSVVQTYGSGGSYYTDRYSIFTFIERRDTYWQTPRVKAGDVKTQWERAVALCGMGSITALSPEAKGKIERPYRWLQDRVVRACGKQHVSSLEQAAVILRAEVDRYNNRQVHSTTGEIPSIRFWRAYEEQRTVFKPFVLPSPYTSDKDVFCLSEERVVNGYNHIRWRGGYITLPNRIPEGARVELHIIPDAARPELRVWYNDELVQSILLAPHRT